MSAFVSSGSYGASRDARRIASAPPDRRSSTETTPQTSKPSARTASIACTVEPPVVTTSSTIRQRSPWSSGGPSTRRWSPCCLASSRTKNAFTSAPPASAAQAGASAPIVSPPTAGASHWRAESATRSASAAKPPGPRTARVLARLGGQGLPCRGHRGAILGAAPAGPAPAGLHARRVEHAFGRGESLALGVEEELLLVDPGTLALDHRASELLPRLGGAMK